MEERFEQVVKEEIWMVNKYMKKCLTSAVIKKMRLKLQ